MKLPNKPLVKVPLFKHQEDGWRRALNELIFGGGGFGLLYEMGCGKTLTAIAIMGSLWEMGLLRRVLIVAPSFPLSVTDSAKSLPSPVTFCFQMMTE